MRRSAPAAVLLCVLTLSICSADTTRYLDIPAGKLTTALELLVRRSQVELIYSPDELEGLQTRGVRGVMSTRQALTRLLEGTGLVMTMHPSGAILITRGEAVPGKLRRKHPQTPATSVTAGLRPSRTHAAIHWG